MPSVPRPVVRVSVPAKINLHLTVGPRRPDGFHELCTVFHAVDLFDEVVASTAPSLSLSVTGHSAGVPTDDTNIAWRAVELLAREVGVEPAVRLRLHKRIPVAGGMAGGSADAAGALLACNAVWGTPVSPQRLTELGAELGSDVPFPLAGGTAVGTGRGEMLTPIDCPPTHWVLVPAQFGIAAGDAYRELDRLRAAGTHLPAAAWTLDDIVTHLADAALAQAGNGYSVATVLHNDLQPAAVSLRPELADVLGAADGSGAAAWIVSGSGPTCAFSYPTRAEAERAATTLGARFPGAVAASGPVSTKVCLP